MARPQKLTPIEKMSLYQEHIDGRKKEELAVKYGVSVRTIDRILKDTKKGAKIDFKSH